MKILGRYTLAVMFVAAVALASNAALSDHQEPTAAKTKTVKAPKAGTLYGAIVGGLKLIKAGSFDAWIAKYCHPDALCYNANVKRTLKRYNLKQLKKQAGFCLAPDGNSLIITREQKMQGQEKVFVKCNPKGSPKPFWLKKKGNRWYWTKVAI